MGCGSEGSGVKDCFLFLLIYFEKMGETIARLLSDLVGGRNRECRGTDAAGERENAGNGGAEREKGEMQDCWAVRTVPRVLYFRWLTDGANNGVRQGRCHEPREELQS